MRPRQLTYVVLMAAPWLVWAVAIIAIRALVRATKDPRLYTGTCYKPNGLAVACSLDQWLVWDATPAIDIFTFVGALVAAAVTGYVWWRHERSGVRR